jgi:Tfp pilus assembly protein PilF
VPLEFSEWQHARHVSYAAQMGLSEALRANGADLLTLPSVFGWPEAARHRWWQLVREMCAGRTFDQVWIEVVHSKWSDVELVWFASLAPVRVGMIMESLTYQAETCSQNPSLEGRKDHVWRRLGSLTHALAVDESDVEALNRVAGLKALWWPQAVPSRFIGSLPKETSPTHAVFAGMVYGERKAWLDHPELKSLLQLLPSPEDATALPRLFDDVNAAVCSVLMKGESVPSQLLVRHAEILGCLRGESFSAWLRGLQQGSAVVNLASLFQGYAGRVFEAMAAGRPVISWEVENRPLTRSLFESEKEILLFSKSSPSELAEQIRRVQNDSGLARRLAENAQQRLKQLHTLEWRITQILDWITYGEQPDFGSVLTNRFRKSSSARPGLPLAPLEPVQLDTANPALTNELLCAFGNALAETGDAADAKEYLDIVIARESNHEEAALALAGLALREHNFQDCRRFLDQVLVREPRHLGALRVLADLASQVGLTAEADRVREMVARSRASFPVRVSIPSPAAPGEYSQTPNAISSDMRAWLVRRLGAVLRNDLCSQEAKVQGGVPTVAKLGLLVQVRLFLKQGDLVAAWQAGVEAIRLRPFHPECFLVLAEIAQAAGDVTKARQCAEHARRLAPNWKPARKFLKSLAPNLVSQKAELPALPSDLISPAPRLTVCLIARNEEQFIGACLESVRGVAGQIIVMDTGSTDRTKEISASLGAEVYSFEWIDDFSAARNAALERATGDWVLILDADEELPPSSRELLQKEMRAGEVMAYRLPIVDAGKTDNGCNYVPRLFRNAPGIYFTGRIHEHAFGSLESRRKDWGLENRLSQTTLVHYGYTEELTRRREKVVRNLRLLQWAVEEQPGDANLLMNLGLELIRSDLRNEGIARYCEAFHLLSAHPADAIVPELRETLLSQLSTHLIASRRFADATQVLQSPLAKAGGLTASMHLTLGLALMDSKNFAGAAEEFRQCIAKRSLPALTPVDPNIRKAVPHHCLAEAMAAQGRWDAAEKCFRTALAEDPASVPVRLDFARYLHQRGRSIEALTLLHQTLSAKGDAAEQMAPQQEREAQDRNEEQCCRGRNRWPAAPRSSDRCRGSSRRRPRPRPASLTRERRL